AIGAGTADWISRRAPASLRVSPFAYFLPGRDAILTGRAPGALRLVFVGALIRRKRVDLLLTVLAELAGHAFTLEVVGDGEERERLEKQAGELLPGRVSFVGTLGMAAAVARIAAADCLVLPSDHDGWGAVVSEAQINGTPVVCSSECGAAVTVRSSGEGGVFAAGCADALRSALAKVLTDGPIGTPRRERLAGWARCLTAACGAEYLLAILAANAGRGDPVRPPWEWQAAVNGIPDR
ncbi:MAG: glycosyltransferase family 4 protein, partial [Sphingomonadales bacterium]|nr:glycosyltransferase family 4 protein [Sphingomonadales bacterium]